MSQLTLFDETTPSDLEAGYEKDYDIQCQSLAQQSHNPDLYCQEGENESETDSINHIFTGVRREDFEFEKPRIHIFQKCDTMESICKKYNVSVCFLL